jgi:uncharacterized protein (TIGR02145 family)
MRKNSLIIGTFLAITAILFNIFGASSSTGSRMTEKVEGSIESTDSGTVVTIGSQVWTTKNLDVSAYRNGDIIPQVQDPSVWKNLTTGAWCYYDNDTIKGAKYGKLYNWYAVNDPRGLAPKGYHIPTDTEWTQLTNHLGGKASAKMKTTSGWEAPNFNGSNSSGFSGLPGGARSDDGPFNSIGNIGHWWSSTEVPTDYAWQRSLSGHRGTVVFRHFSYKALGFSVRCLRD